MSFFNTLLKGFVRSAVNQVGRDGGKVISNQVYGNRHSTPIRASSMNETRAKFESDGFTNHGFLSSSFIWYPFLLFICVLFPVFGPLYLFYKAGQNLMARTIRLYSFLQVPITVPDRRHSSGQRIEGYRVQRSGFVIVDAEPNERRLLIIKGIIYLLFAIAISYFHYTVWLESQVPG